MAPVATEALDSAHASTGLRALVDRDALGALVLAGAIPFLFLHERYQPDLSVGAGTTTVDIRLSDLAVLVVVAFAAAAAVRTGVSHLRAAGRCGSAGARCWCGSRSRRSARFRSTTHASTSTS